MYKTDFKLYQRHLDRSYSCVKGHFYKLKNKGVIALGELGLVVVDNKSEANDVDPRLTPVISSKDSLDEFLSRVKKMIDLM